jgi:hypothetical protein
MPSRMLQSSVMMAMCDARRLPSIGKVGFNIGYLNSAKRKKILSAIRDG